uniref:IS110 family transposase n=1 Tax=Paenibacillus agricola TaxID=2716264 RepID=UPI001FB5DE7F|nr:transposase [Paenibacillus agricola]
MHVIESLQTLRTDIDVKDAEWIAQLLRHGLLKASFIPNRNQRELRELVRYRRSIIEERARQHNRIQKVLEGANIKLGSVVSDIMGVSSKDMLHAISDGEEDPVKLASFARRTMKKKKEELELALRGYVNPHQRMMLKTILSHIEFLPSAAHLCSWAALVPGHNESAGKRKEVF